MPSRARLQQTNRAADSAIETPSGTHRDFCPHRKGRQTPSRGLIGGRDSTESPCPRSPPRGCFLADLRPQSSANKEQRPTIYESKNFTNRGRPQRGGSLHWLFQKQIHAVEVDNTIPVVQCIHPQDPADSGAALRQCEVGQYCDAKFRRRRFEVANLKVVDLSCANLPCRATCKMRRDVCCFHRNADRLKESFVENRNK